MAEHYIIDGKEHVYESADEKHHIKKNITLNGTYKAESEPGDVTGYSEVNVNVEGGGSATLITKNITENGTYNASSDQADGYSKVVVDVEAPAPETKYKAVHIVTHSVDGWTASVDVIYGYTYGNIGFIPVSTVTVLHSDYRGSYYSFEIGKVGYPVNWKVYAEVPVSDGVNEYEAGDLIKEWNYTTQVDFYLYSTIPYTATLIEKEITENGTYTASSDNADGYSSVTVNVPVPQPTPSFEVTSSMVESALVISGEAEGGYSLSGITMSTSVVEVV